MAVCKPSFINPLFMDLALELARKSRPSPNPRVGAVVVQNGEIVGRGFHKQAGQPHAEIIALNEAGESANGADIYVTLEPCNHHGKTGPCTEAIQKAGISRVVIGMRDPDTLVNGDGISRLKKLGIDVSEGIREEECRQLLDGYTFHRKTGSPLVILKAAITLDGNLATSSGDSQWISSIDSRKVAHQMRAESDAVIVGIGTVLADDPELTVRHVEGINPLRVVMDSRLRILLDTKLITTAMSSPVIIAHTDQAPPSSIIQLNKIPGVKTLRCADQLGRVDPADLIQQLNDFGVLSILIEGGSSIHGSFAKSMAAHRVALFIAPKILGEGLPWITFGGIKSVKDALSLTNTDIKMLSQDILIRGHLSYEH
jgi:diaminohydroxyphosphoribosylaminopyrimidine deaminase / 5-amino-6-(5-phosphoribosylamino)uracil reductase